MPAIKIFGWQFVTDSYWDPAADMFGGLAFIFGTLITAFVAVLSLAGPVSVFIALFINEILPPRIASVLGLFVEMIAAIPSIVFGLWGLFYLAPWVQQDLTPFSQTNSRIFAFLSRAKFWHRYSNCLDDPGLNDRAHHQLYLP
jgi:phosphate transport system permease protein